MRIRTDFRREYSRLTCASCPCGLRTKIASRSYGVLASSLNFESPRSISMHSLEANILWGISTWDSEKEREVRLFIIYATAREQSQRAKDAILHAPLYESTIANFAITVTYRPRKERRRKKRKIERENRESRGSAVPLCRLSSQLLILLLFSRVPPFHESW